MPVPLDHKLERKLRDEIVNGNNDVKEYTSVIAALWFECMVSLDMQYTMRAFDPGGKFTEAVETCVHLFAKEFRGSRSISKVTAFTCLCPLARFYCSFVPEREVNLDLEIMPYFQPHPRSEDFMAITPQGLAYLLPIVRAYFAHRDTLRRLKWQEEAQGAPASDVQVQRAVDMVKGRGDSYATDQLQDEIRQRVIGRLMPPHAIYNINSEMAIASRDMYLVMREVDPDGLNNAHRLGSIPFLLALGDPNDTITKEILLACILIAPTKCSFYDASYGDLAVPATSPKLSLGYYCGEYVVVECDGALRHGFGAGIKGAVGAALCLIELYDKVGYEYITGIAKDYRPSLQEVEFTKASCF